MTRAKAQGPFPLRADAFFLPTSGSPAWSALLACLSIRENARARLVEQAWPERSDMWGTGYGFVLLEETERRRRRPAVKGPEDGVMRGRDRPARGILQNKYL